MKFLIIEDHPIVRQAICEKIHKVFADSEFIELDHIENKDEILESCKPDFIIIDLELYGKLSLDTIEKLRDKYPIIPILIHSMYDDKTVIQQAIKAGANGYVTKYDSLEQIEQAIKTLLNKRKYLSARATDVLMDEMQETKTKKEAIDFEKLLTKAEYNVFKYIGQEKSRKEIAAILNNAPSTVDTYFERLKKKLNLESSHKLVCLAIKHVQFEQ